MSPLNRYPLLSDKKQSKQKMKIDSKTGKLIINQFDVHHIISRFIDGGSLQEAIEKELYHHYSHYGLEGEWDFDANKIVFERRGQYF